MTVSAAALNEDLECAQLDFFPYGMGFGRE